MNEQLTFMFVNCCNVVENFKPFNQYTYTLWIIVFHSKFKHKAVVVSKKLQKKRSVFYGLRMLQVRKSASRLKNLSS
jgi:hypothetical protein